jgi:hypothetical protein
MFFFKVDHVLQTTKHLHSKGKTYRPHTNKHLLLKNVTQKWSQIRSSNGTYSKQFKIFVFYFDVQTGCLNGIKTWFPSRLQKTIKHYVARTDISNAVNLQSLNPLGKRPTKIFIIHCTLGKKQVTGNLFTLKELYSHVPVYPSAGAVL